jgi:hypothetical protein
MINIMNAPILFEWTLGLNIGVFLAKLLIILGFFKIFQIVGKRSQKWNI